MKFLNAVINDIRKGENIDVYLTALICVVVAILDLLGIVQPEIITAATLLALGVLSFSALSTRKSLEELNGTIQRIEGGQGAEVFFKDRSSYVPLSETTAYARHICLLGPTLANIFAQWSGYLLYDKLNKQGAIIQVLILNPDSPAVESAAKCMNEPLDNLRKDIARSLAYIEAWLKEGIQAGSVEARLMSAHPNYSMVLIDPDEPHGKMFVEFIGYYSRVHLRPHIELTRQRDGKWYEYFLQQYHRIWQDSQVRLTNRQGSNAA